MTPASALLLLAAACLVLAVLVPRLARWSWAAAAALVAAWVGLQLSIAGGLMLLAGIAAASTLEPPAPPAQAGFNDLVARIGALAAGVAGSVLVVVRVAQESDVTRALPGFALSLLGVAALIHMLARRGPVDEARAGRLVITVAAAAALTGGTRAVAVSAAAAACVTLTAAAARRLAPAS